MGAALTLPVHMLGHSVTARNKVTVKVVNGSITLANHEFDPLLSHAVLKALEDHYGQGQLCDGSGTHIKDPHQVHCGHYVYSVSDSNAHQHQQQQQAFHQPQQPQKQSMVRTVSAMNNATAQDMDTQPPADSADITITHGIRHKVESGSYVIPRIALQSDVTDLLSNNGFVMLRGGPGTGKTSVMDALGMEIEDSEEGTGKFEHVTYFSCASVQQGKEDFVTAFKRCTNKDWSFIASGVVREGAPHQGIHLICIDDFHLSYEHSQTTYRALYEKTREAMHVNIDGPPAYRILAAATYGGNSPFHHVISSNTKNYAVSTPLYLTHIPVVCVEPTPDNMHDKSIRMRAGLLLTDEECELLWTAFLTAPCFKRLQLQQQFQGPATKQQVFELAKGHVGVFCLILEELIRRLQTTTIQQGNGDVIARQLFNSNDIYQAITTGSCNGTVRGFMRSITEDLDRQVFNNLVGGDSKLEAFQGEHEHLTPAILRLVRDGYLHMNDEGEVSFPSPLHEQWYKQLLAGREQEAQTDNNMDTSM